MPTYSITDPDGRTHTIDGPAGATREQVIAEIQKQLPYQQRTVSEQLPIDQREAGLGTMAKQGFNRAMTGLGSTVTDLIPALAGSALGFKDYAAEQLAEHKAKMEASEAQNPTAFKSFRDVRGVGDAPGFIAETLGELVPDLAALFTGVGASSVVGRRVALKGAEKLVADRAAEAAAKLVARKGLEGDLAAQAAKDFTEKFVERAAPFVSQIAARGSAAGITYGLPASSYALNAPDVFESIYEKTGEQNPGIAATMGVPIAMLDTFLPGRILDKLGFAGKAKLASNILNQASDPVKASGFWKAASKEFGTVTGVEGLTESAQEALTVAAELMAGAKDGFFSQENIDRYINAGLKGAIGGGAFGAPGAARQGFRAKAEQARLDELAAIPPNAVPQLTGVFTPEEEAAETARRQAQDTGRFDPAAVAPFDAAVARETQRFDPRTSAIATTQPDLFGLAVPPPAPVAPEASIAITKKDLVDLGVPKNAPIIKRIAGLDLTKPENLSIAIRELAAFARNPKVNQNVADKVLQVARDLQQAPSPGQGALQFAPPAPQGPFNTQLQTQLAQIQKQQEEAAVTQQRQTEEADRIQQDMNRLGNVADAQRQLDIAGLGGTRSTDGTTSGTADTTAEFTSPTAGVGPVISKESRNVGASPTEGATAPKQSGVVSTGRATEAPVGGTEAQSGTLNVTPEEQAAIDIVNAVDKGGLPLNPFKINAVARGLGLEVNKRARPEDTIDRLRKAVRRFTSIPAVEPAAAPALTTKGKIKKPAAKPAAEPAVEPAAAAEPAAKPAAKPAVEPAAAAKPAVEPAAAAKPAAEPVAPAQPVRGRTRNFDPKKATTAYVTPPVAKLAAADQDLRNEAKRILTASGMKQDEINNVLRDYDEITQNDLNQLRKDFPPEKTTTANKVSETELDNLSDPDDVQSSIEATRPATAQERTTVQEIKNAMKGWFINFVQAQSRLKIVQSFSELPKATQGRVLVLRRSSAVPRSPKTTAGFVLDGTAYLIADNIARGSEMAVYMHEIGAHIGLKGREGKIMQAINLWGKAPEGSAEKDVFDAMQRRMQAAGEVSAVEQVAYAVEEAIKAGIVPRAVKERMEFSDIKSVQDFINWLAQYFKAEIDREFKLDSPQLSPQQLVDLAFGAALEAVAKPEISGSRTAQLSMSDMRKLPKQSDRQFAESVDVLRREDQSRYIVEATKTSDDINKIANEVLGDVAANPENYAVQVKNLTAAQYFRDVDTNEPVDYRNPDEQYRLSPEGQAFARMDPSDLTRILQQEAEQVTDQRRQSLSNLANYLLNNEGYTPTEAGRIVLLASKFAYNETKEGVSIVKLANNNRYVMDVSGELAARINDKLNSNLSPRDALKEAVTENIVAQEKANKASNKQGWVKYPKSEEYEDAAELSQECVGSGWCTAATGTAQNQLSGGDFWLYYDNGKPQIALRTTDGKLAESPKGRLDNQRLSSEYQRIAENYLATTKDVTGGEDYLEGMKAMTAYRQYKKGGDIAPLRKYLTYVVKNNVFEEARFFEPHALANYSALTKYNVADPELKGVKVTDGVPFNIILRDTKTTIKKFGGYLHADKLTDAPMLESVGGYLHAVDLTNAPMLESVGGYLNADKLTDAPMLKTVGGYLHANKLTDASMLESVGGNLYAVDLTNAPMLKTVGGDLNANKLTDAPMLKTVGRRLYANKLTDAPMLESVGGKKVNPIIPVVTVLNNPNIMALTVGLEMPLPSTVVTALNEGNFTEAMQLMAKTQDPRTAKLATRLLEAAVNPKVVVVKNLKNEAGEAVAGLYDPRTNTIRLDSVNGMSAHVLIHETGHAALSHVLDDASHPVTKQMQKLFDAVVPLLDTTYGAQDLQEFAAEALGNPEFRGKLNSLTPAEGTVSAWQRFQNIVGNFFRRLFGVSSKPIESAMDKVDQLIDQILSPAPEFRDAGNLYAIAQSKTRTEKFIDSGAAFIEKLPLMNQERANDIHAFITNILPNTGKKGVLSLLPLNVLADVAKKYVTGAEEINSLTNKKAGVIKQRTERIEALVTRANKWAVRAGKAMVSTFNEVVYSSTIEGVDPTRLRTYYEDKLNAAKKISNPEAAAEATKKLAAYDKVRAEYNKLLPEGQRLYVSMRDAYAQMYELIKSSLSVQIDEALGNTPENKKIKNNLFKRLIDRAALDPYFPLTRTGDYWLTYNYIDATGQVYRPIQAFETPRARDLARAELEADSERTKQLKAKNLPDDVEYFNKLDRTHYNKVPPTAFINDVIKTLRNENVGDDKIELVVQLFVDTLPETAFAKSFQPRENIPGFERDAIGALSKKLFATSSQIANMEYAPKFNALINKMEEDYRKSDKLGESTTNAKLYVEEFKTRVKFINNPTISTFSKLSTSFGFGYLMGANPASAIVNLFQVPMVALPYLAGAYNKNYGDAFSEILKAYSEFMQTGTSKATPVFGIKDTDMETRRAMVSLDNIGPGHPFYNKYKTLIGVLRENGFLGASMAYDTLEVPGSTGALQKVNLIMSWMHHHSDQMNRQITAMAAYNLELAKLKAEGKTGEAAETAAANKAIYATEMTQGGTSAASAPSIAQKSIPRVLFMFKRYGVMMLYIQIKTLRAALSNESKEVKKAAMLQFAGMTGAAALFAGLQGIPFFGVAALMYNLFKDDDEDDLEIATRRTFGPELTYGLFSYLTGMDVSQRISATDLLIREMRTGDKTTFMTSLLEQLLGPVYGITNRMVRGYDLMSEGYLARGMEQALPVVLGNVFKSYRFATEGAQTLRGDPITDDIGWGAGAQFLGFSPYDVARQNEINSRLKGFDKYVTQKQSKLARQYYTAGRMGDYEKQAEIREDLQELFSKHPGLGSVQAYLQRSMEAHKKSTTKMLNGITVSEKLRPELVRYAEGL